METLEEFRKRKDEFFRTGADSPISTSELDSFSGLKYYSENPALKFEVGLEPIGSQDFEFETSTGEKCTYKKAGKLKFEVNGELGELSIYQAESRSYFLPFRDATSGKETYGAGRYLDVEGEDGKFTLDFNYAYNPYCAYSPNFSCPLPPIENWLKVPIEAGEKKYSDLP